MKTRWLVTPYFFDQYDPSLVGAAPEGTLINGPHDVPDQMPSTLAEVHKPIFTFVRSAVAEGLVPISVAGDCAGSLPVMSALQASGMSPVLVWLDAHTDFNTHDTSPTGFLGGMPMAMMVGRGDLSIANNAWLTPVAEEDVWQIGARDFEGYEHEEALLDESDVNQAEMKDLGSMKFDRPVHFHMDNDVIDASEVPANNYPALGGPSVAETIEACASFIENNEVVAISFSGWNGLLDGAEKTREACARVLTALVAAVEK
jgi:arginase